MVLTRGSFFAYLTFFLKPTLLVLQQPGSKGLFLLPKVRQLPKVSFRTLTLSVLGLFLITSDGEWACPCPVLPACPLFFQCPPCPCHEKMKWANARFARATIPMPGQPAGTKGQSQKPSIFNNTIESFQKIPRYLQLCCYPCSTI